MVSFIENSNQKLMMTGGSPIDGHLQILAQNCCQTLQTERLFGLFCHSAIPCLTCSDGQIQRSHASNSHMGRAAVVQKQLCRLKTRQLEPSHVTMIPKLSQLRLSPWIGLRENLHRKPWIFLVNVCKYGVFL